MFLLADSGGEDRILIFGSEASGGWSQQMEQCSSTARFQVPFPFFLTFSLYFLVCPPLFHQLFIILSKREGFVFSVLFCLLPDKTQ